MRAGRTLTTYDMQAMCWKDSLRQNPKYAWKHSNGAAHVWSGDAVTYLKSPSDERYDVVRTDIATISERTPANSRWQAWQGHPECMPTEGSGRRIRSRTASGSVEPGELNRPGPQAGGVAGYERQPRPRPPERSRRTQPTSPQ
jgi:hypothetical protein